MQLTRGGSTRLLAFLALVLVVAVPAAAQDAASVLRHSSELLPLKKCAEARGDLERLFAASPDLPDGMRAGLLANYALALSCLGEHRAAIRAWHAVTELSPRNAEVWSSLAREYELAGELDSAIMVQQRCVEIDSSRDWAWGELARYHTAAGDAEAMRTAYERAAATASGMDAWNALVDSARQQYGALDPNLRKAVHRCLEELRIIAVRSCYLRGDAQRRRAIVTRFTSGCIAIVEELLQRFLDAEGDGPKIRDARRQAEILGLPMARDVATLTNDTRLLQALLAAMNNNPDDTRELPAWREWTKLHAGAAALLEQGQCADAAAAAGEALEFARDELEDRPDAIAQSLGTLAEAYLGMERYASAEPPYREALGLLQTLPEQRELFASAACGLGRLYRAVGRFEEADSVFRETATILQEERGAHPRSYAVALCERAGLLVDRDRLSDAEALYSEVTRFLAGLGGQEDSAYAVAMNHLASLYVRLRRYERAEQLFMDAQALFKRRCGRNSEAYGLSLARLGAMYREMGDRDAQADQALVDAKRILEPRLPRNRIAYAMCLVDLAGVYCRGQHRDMAESLLQEAREQFLQVHGPDHYEYGAYLTILAQFYALNRRFAEAERLFLQARDVIRATRGTDHPDYARALNNLVRLYIGIGRTDGVAALVHEASDILERDVERTGARMNESQQEQYLEMVQSEFELYNSCSLAMVHRDPAVLGEMYDHRLALKGRLFVSARALRERIAQSGRTLEGRLEELLREQEKRNAALGMTEEQRSNAGYDLDAITRRINDLDADLCVRSQAFARAAARATPTWRAVRDSLRSGEAAVEIVRFRVFDGSWTKSVAYAALIVDRASVDHPRLVLLRNGDELERRGWMLYDSGVTAWKGGRDRELMAEAYRLFWREIDDALGQDTVVFLSPDGVFSQINVETLVADDGRFVGERRTIRLLSSTRELARQRDRLDRPAAASASAVSTACIVGMPNYWMSTEERKRYARQQVASNVRDRAPDAGAIGPIAEAGDEAERSLNCATLPFSRLEVQTIDSLLRRQGWETLVDTSDDALEEEVKSVQQPRVLHLSTHGFFLEDADQAAPARGSTSESIWELQRRAGDPLLRSGLLFNGACASIRRREVSPGIDDGILYADEAQALNLEGTELVVLSACETGLGVMKAGEGVYGLQRSLQLAGARNVLMSLWAVNDAATSLLMRKFYEYWLSGCTMHDALRAAQRFLRSRPHSDYASPYFWGAFVLMEG